MSSPLGSNLVVVAQYFIHFFLEIVFGNVKIERRHLPSDLNNSKVCRVRALPIISSCI